MASSRTKSLSAHRRRLKQRGIARLEVRVHRRDVALVRRLIEALADPTRERDVRALLREHFGADAGGGFKALIAAAPLDGIDLARRSDDGRPVEL